MLTALLVTSSCGLLDEPTPSLTNPSTSETSEPSTEETTEPTTEATSEETTEPTTEETTEPTTEETTEPTTEETTEPTTEETTEEPTEPSSEEPTEPSTEPTPDPVPSTPAPGTLLSNRVLYADDIERLNQVSNDPGYGWWYHVPSERGQGIPATIDPGIARIIAEYDTMWNEPVEGEKRIYLTLDAGYEFEDNTSRILDTAKEKNVPLNFFITGSLIDNHADLVLRMVDEGHLIGNHTNMHYNQVQLLEDGEMDRLEQDIVTAARKYKDLTGEEFSPYLRPPEGKYSRQSLAVINALGYQPVMWSFAHRDWETDNQPDPARSLERVVGDAFDGSVMLLHTVSKTNVEILGDVIDELQAQGYVFRRLDE